jgi:protein phosphatase PTC6
MGWGGRHGGSEVSKYLKENLHELVQEAKVTEIPDVIRKYRGLGGYLRRYRGGPLNRFREPEGEDNDLKGITLDEMCVLAFLQVRPLLFPYDYGLMGGE